MKIYKNFSKNFLSRKRELGLPTIESRNDPSIKSEQSSVNLIKAQESGKLNKESNTISFQLGKALIDTFNGNKSTAELPMRLFDLYIDSLKRKDKDLGGFNKVLVVAHEELFNKDVQNIKTIIAFGTSQVKNNPKVPDSNIVDKHYLLNNQQKIVSYMSLERFAESQSVQNERKSLLLDVDRDFCKAFGIKKTNIFNILADNTIKINSSDNKVIYTKSEIFLPCEAGESFTCSFNISTMGSVNLTVLLEFYEDTQSERIDVKILPLNKGLNIIAPPQAKFLRLGLKIQGQGLVEKNKIQFIQKNIQTNKPYPEAIGWQLKEGISIIIPSYKGEATILSTLDSIAKQKNIDLSILEVLVIINGELDNSPNLIKEYINSKPNIDIKTTILKKAGASLARNYGIKKATKEYVVFCDDDDMLSPNYLASLYKIASKNTLGFSYIHDLNVDGTMNSDNAINRALIKANQEQNQDLKNLTSALTMIACKIIPTLNLKKLKFDETLRSGEDVVFFSKYYCDFKPKLIISSNEDAFYIRRLRDSSVSRQQLSFDFNVTQRLQVIKGLLEINDTSEENLIISKVRAQCGFISRYLKEYPEDYAKFHLKLIELDINRFPYKYLQNQLQLPEAETLVISFCYAPFVDTSAVIVSKRINEMNKFCDVVSANMAKVRKVNTELMHIDAHLVRDTYLINVEPSFGNWQCIESFTVSMLAATQAKKYNNIYSRSFWPASHFAAFEYKRQHPNVKWIAEFSDPIILDIEGKIRFAEVPKEWVSFIVNEFNLGSELLTELNLYVWAELLVYLLADEIIFTCKNQKALMLERFPYQDISARAKWLSVIKPHPTLPKEFYTAKDVKYPLDRAMINMAYFGAFYKTRRLDDIIEVMKWYDKNKSNYSEMKVPHIHIFTEQVDSAKAMIKEEELENYFTINHYLSYLEFLSVSNQMDVLLVNDAKANEIFGINPYLPSKVSDYSNSNAKIWAFYEKGSALSKYSGVDFYSEIGDLEATKKILLETIAN